MKALAPHVRVQIIEAVSHDLRGPINTLLGWATLLQRSAPVPMQRGLQSIERATRLLALFVEDLPGLFWIIDSPEPQRGSIALGPVVHAVADEVFAASKVDVEVIADEAVRVSLDERMLRLALRAVLFQFVRGGPCTPIVRATLDGDALEIALTEPTRGSLPVASLAAALRGEQEERLFVTGAGLSLLVAHQATALHGGEVRSAEQGIVLRFANTL